MSKAKLKIKRGDTVKVISGKERGKTGKVLRIDNDKGRVFVERLNMVKRHARPSQKNPQGMLEREGSIHISNVMYYCSRCGDGVRVGVKKTDDGRLRVCRSCETEFE